MLISIGSLIDQSWQMYRRNFSSLIGVTGWLLLVAIISVIGYALFPPASTLLSGRSFTGVEWLGKGILFVNDFIITPLLAIWIYATLIRLIQSFSEGRSLSVKAAEKEGRAHFWPLIVGSIYFAVILLLPLLLLAPGAGILFAGVWIPSSSGILGLLGTAALVAGIFAGGILAMWWGIRSYFYSFSIVLENERGWNALKHSWKMVQGRYFAVFVRLVVPKLLFLVVFGAIFYFLSYLLSFMVSASAGLNIDLNVRLQTIVTQVVLILQAILINPLVTIADYLLFRNLK